MKNLAPNSIGEVLRSCYKLLESSSLTPRLDAEILMAHVLIKHRAYLHAWPEKPIPDDQLLKYSDLAAKRHAGYPVAYLTGTREFWSMDFKVGPDVLIPRPETELLVELALKLIPVDAHWRVADLGTGSGVIAIVLAQERPKIKVYACDLCEKALLTAKHNAEIHGIENISFFQSNWFSGLPKKKYDLIISNPPYIAKNDPHLKSGDVRFEPRLSLQSGDDGFDDFNAIIEQANTRSPTKSWLIFEHGHNQAKQLSGLLADSGYSNIQTHKDLQGHPRATIAQWDNHIGS